VDVDQRPGCYRHPDRRAGVRCRRCERPICPDCMVTASVGHQCPECVHRSGDDVRRYRARPSTDAIPVTLTLVVINVAVYLVTGLGAGSGMLGVNRGDALSTNILNKGILWGPAVREGEWWRLVTGGFLHAGLVHLAFNMLALWSIGAVVERTFGPVRMLAIYGTSLLAGSLVVLIMAPDTPTLGASGAVFGLFGCVFVVTALRAGKQLAWQRFGGLLILNGLISLAPGISLGGHLGGFVAGAAIGWCMDQLPRRTGRSWAPLAVCAVLAVGCVVGSLVAARSLATSSPAVVDSL
jgi:membrane associated rhomboid family serine protease